VIATPKRDGWRDGQDLRLILSAGQRRFRLTTSCRPPRRQANLIDGFGTRSAPMFRSRTAATPLHFCIHPYAVGNHVVPAALSWIRSSGLVGQGL